MSSKQFQAGEPLETRQPVHQSHLNLEKSQNEGDKRPFAPHLPALIQRATQAPQSITPAEAAYLQHTVGNQALGRMLRVQRQEEEEELQAKPSSTMADGEVSADIEDGIQRAKGGGLPLPANTQSSMGQAFNADFSGVKIHTGSQSDQLNQSIQACAFTTGQDIFFRDGAYNPDNSTGQELLAHELTHTIQQTGASDLPVQRWSINSLISGPGHESLTEESLHKAGYEKPKRNDYATKKEYKTALKKYKKMIAQYKKGATFNDDPERLLGGTGTSFGLKFLSEEKKAEKGHKWGTKDRMLGRTHFGDLQFLHGMASKPSERAIVTQRKIMLWAEFTYKIAIGAIASNARIDQVDVQPEKELAGSVKSIKQLFPLQKAVTIAKFFGVGDDGDVKMQAMASLLHMLQDTFCASHSERVTAKRRGEETARIHSFHAYPSQDHDRHGLADKLGKGKTLGQKVANTAGAQDAVDAGAGILRLLKQGLAWDAANGPEAYLQKIFALTPTEGEGETKSGVITPGPGRQFRKSVHEEYQKKTKVKRSRRSSRLLSDIDTTSAIYDKMLLYNSTVLNETQAKEKNIAQKEQVQLIIDAINTWLQVSSVQLDGKSYLMGHKDTLIWYRALLQRDIKIIDGEIVAHDNALKTFID